MGFKKWLFNSSNPSIEGIATDQDNNKKTKEKYNLIASEEDIKNCFRLILGRNPNPEEWKGHSSLAGLELNLVVSSYLNSLEFKSRNLLTYDENIKKCITSFGFEIYVNLKDPLIGNPISQGIVYEKNVSNTFTKYLKKDMTILDIGANIGWYSLLTAHSLQDECKIYAFEPYSFNSKLILASQSTNNFKSINLIQSAVGNQTGTVQFGATGSNGQCQEINNDIDTILNSDIVNMIKIDDIIHEKIDIIKIDIEGAEYKALIGSIKTLKESLPIIFSEFTPTAMPSISGVGWDEYLNLMINLGYKIKIIEEDIIECNEDINKVFKIFKEQEKDHLDLIFYIDK